MGRVATELRAAERAVERPRRLRATAPLRALVRETRLQPKSLVAPLFVVSGRTRREPIPAMPGNERLSPDLATERAAELAALGIGGVLLFGIPDGKDDAGSGAADADGPVPETLRRMRAAALDLVLAADVCL